MRLTQLRDLIAVAEQGGLRRGARHLGLAQPAISKSIRDLEHELGAPLFERASTGMVLTPLGKAFLRRSTAVQAELDRAYDEAKQFRGIHNGTVRIGLSPAPHVAMLPRVLPRFRRRYPDVRLDITEGLFPLLGPVLRDAGLDFYIGSLSENGLGSEYSVETLLETERVVLCRPGHPLEKATSFRALASAQWVVTSVAAKTDAELLPLFERRGLPAPIIAVQAHSALTMISVAACSDLLVILPQLWLGFVEGSGLLHRLRLDEKLESPPICIVSRSQLPLTPVAEHLCDLFRRAAAN